MLQGFFTPGEPDTTGDYEDRVRKRRLAEAMMAQGMDYSPVKSWTQGAARIAQALVGGYASSKYDREQKAADAPGRAILEEERQRRMGGSPSPAMPGAPVPSGGGAPRAAAFSGSQDEFVASMMPHALKVSQETGLDPRLVIAQSALETGWGKSAPGNNFFGIKSHGRAGGNTMPTTEVVNGQPVRMNDSFRAYADMGESAGDYVAFLRANPRYRDVLGAQGLDAQIEAMARSGYATDPNYGAKLRQIAAGLQAPDGMPMVPVPSDAPPMAYAPGQQAIANAMPQNPPMPPPRPGAALVGAVGGQQPQPVTSPPIPQPDGSQRLLAAALSSSSSPQLRAQLMQLYQMTQRDEGVTTVDLGDRVALINRRGQITGYLSKGKDANWGVVGQNEFGNNIYGWIDARSQSAQPAQIPGTVSAAKPPAAAPSQAQEGAAPSSAPASPAPSIPPAPPGVDPKLWRDEKTREMARGEKFTESQGKALTFGNRMENAERTLSQFEEEGLGQVNRQVARIPIIGNKMVSENYQKFAQAEREFINAVLRRESGAVIGPDEYKNFSAQYFPQPGDADSLVEQKRQARKVAIDAMKREAGPNYTSPAMPPPKATSKPPAAAAPMQGWSVEVIP